MKKLWKQDRDQGNKLEKRVREWKQVKDDAQGLLNVEQKLILRYLLSLF